jgi:3-keto-disaccharide hydrolase
VKKLFGALIILALLGSIFNVGQATRIAAAADGDGWITLFDGTSLDGWKASEHKESWKLKDGILICNGERSHLFYVGKEAPFKNFELKVEVKAAHNSNSGIYFHTKYQEEGWPAKGFETQVNNTYEKDPKKTGSLYAVKNVTEQLVPDDTWWEQYVIVNGKRVIIKINGKTAVDYTEPDDAKPSEPNFERLIGEGTFALQAHDPNSKVYYRSVKVKRLP